MVDGGKHLGSAVLGLGLLAAAWACWSGRWKAWSRIAVLPAAPIALAPGLGLCFLLAGIGAVLEPGPRDVLFAFALLAAALGCLIAVWGPSWYGPRWYRDRDRTFDPLVPLNAAVASVGGGGGRTQPSSEAIAKELCSGRVPISRWRAHLVSDAWGRTSAMQRIGVVRGHLLLYQEALVFAANAGEDKMRGAPVVQFVPAASIIGVRRVPAGTRPDEAAPALPDLPSRVIPRLRVWTEDEAWVFETAGATKRAREIERRYVGSPSPEIVEER